MKNFIVMSPAGDKTPAIMLLITGVRRENYPENTE